MRKEDIKYCLLLSITIILSYFQLSFFVFTSKWDNLSAFFAYKFTASNWWLAGQLPLWDPYQNLGYPMHANPQGYVWYPITWLLNIPNGYTLYSLNIETVLHIVIAALGAFILSRHLKNNAISSFTAGAIYGLSGFIIATNHMIGFTIAAAWLPWCIWAILNLLKEPNFKHAIRLALFLYLQVTGAYIAFTIVLLYILIAIVLVQLYSKKKLNQAVQKPLLYLLLAGVVAIILSSPYLFSVYDSLSYFSRSNKLGYETELFAGNLNFQSLSTVLIPFIISSKDGLSGVDISLSNCYIGILPLIILFYSFYRLKIKFKYVLAFFLILSLLLGLGIHTPVHKWITLSVPGFNLFRHPYLFVLYAVLIASIVVSYGINFKIFNDKLFKRILLIFGLILLISNIVLLNFTSISSIVNLVGSLSELNEKSNHLAIDHAILQLTISSLIVLSSYLLLRFKSRNLKYLILVIVIDLTLSIQFLGPTNMYYNISFNTAKQYLTSITNENLTNQKADTPIKYFSNDSIQAKPGFWINLNTYQRTTGFEGYNPFVMKSTEDLKESGLIKDVLEHGLFYSKERDVFLSDLKIGYNFFEVTSNSNSGNTLFLSQNYHHNWKAYKNAEPVSITKTHLGTMAIKLPKGNHKIQFVYTNKTLGILFILSVSSLMFTVTFLLVTAKRTRSKQSQYCFL